MCHQKKKKTTNTITKPINPKQKTNTPTHSPSLWPRSHCRGKPRHWFWTTRKCRYYVNMKNKKSRKTRVCSLSRIKTISAIITVNSKMQEYRTGYHTSFSCKIHFSIEMGNTLKVKNHIFYQIIV